MITYLLVFLFGLATICFISIKRESFYRNIFYYLLANLYFLFIVLLLPDGFADDQFEYFSFMKYDFDSLLPKYKIMQIASYVPYKLLSFDLMSLRYLFFINYILILLFVLKKLNLESTALIFLIIMPSIFLHAGLFLREPISYIFITFFIFAILKKKFLIGILSFLMVFIIRPDSAGLLTPLFIYWISNKPRTQFIFSISLVGVYASLITNTPLEILLNGYRALFGMPDFVISLRSISYSAFNLLFGSGVLETATLIMFIETIVVLIMLFNIKNKSILVACWFIGLLIIGSISDNSGFIVRMRSPLIIITFICYFFQEYSNAGFKKNLNTSLN